MRGHEMLETIEHLNPAYIEAEGKKGWLKWGAIAACLCLIFRMAMYERLTKQSGFQAALFCVCPETPLCFGTMQGCRNCNYTLCSMDATMKVYFRAK